MVLDLSALYISGSGGKMTIPGIFEEPEELVATVILNVTQMYSKLRCP